MQVYILRCNDGSFYTGITNNLERRLLEHNREKLGGAKYTRSRGPVELVYSEVYPTRNEALKREYYIKNKLSRQQKEELINSSLFITHMHKA